MNRYFLIALILSLSGPFSKAAREGNVEFVYEIFIGSKSVGQLSAVRRQLADSTVYLITSDIDAQLIIP